MTGITTGPAGSTGGSTSVGGTNVIVYQPGGIAVENVFTDPAALYAYYLAHIEVNVIEIDSSFTSPSVLPALAYQWRADLQLSGYGSVGGYLQLADGSTWNLCPKIIGLLLVESLSSAPILDVAAIGADVTMEAVNFSGFQANGSAVFALSNDAVFALIQVLSEGGYFAAGVSRVVRLEDPGGGGIAALIENLEDQGTVDPDTIESGGGNVTVNTDLIDSNAHFSLDQPGYTSAIDPFGFGDVFSDQVLTYKSSPDISTGAATILPGESQRYDPTGTPGFTLSLAPVGSLNRWRGFTCKAVRVSASVVPVTFDPGPGVTINGAATYVVIAAFGTTHFTWDGEGNFQAYTAIP